MSAIEKKLTEALTSNKLTSDQLAELVDEAEAAIAEVEKQAVAARAVALDPVRSPNPDKAREEMDKAIFARDRLRVLLPRLEKDIRKSVTKKNTTRGLPRPSVCCRASMRR